MSELRDKVRAIMVKAVARHMDLSDAIDEITELIEPKEIDPVFDDILTGIKAGNFTTLTGTLGNMLGKALNQNEVNNSKIFKP